MNPQTEFKYWAFISYSHQDNRSDRNAWGDCWHELVESFKVPEALVRQPARYGELVPERLFPCFQDEKELPTRADLGTAIREALNQSRYLVVICSPRAAASVWVNQEVLEFKRLGREDRILAVIVDGEPNASEPSKGFDPALECFPAALRHPLGADGNLDLARRVEPSAADVRGGDGREASLRAKAHGERLQREKLRVIAGLLGVGFDELVQRDKERQLAENRTRTRRVRKLVAGFVTLLVLAAAAGVFAVMARRQQNLAQSKAHLLEAGSLLSEENWKDGAGHLAQSLRENPFNQTASVQLASFLAEHLWPRQTPLLKASEPLSNVQFNPKANRIIAVSADNTVRLWNPREDKVEAGPFRHSDTVHAVRLSSDGSRLFTLTAAEVGCLWDTHSGLPLTNLARDTEPIVLAEFSPDGTRLVTATYNHATLWNGLSGERIGKPFAHGFTDPSAYFSPDGKRVILAGTIYQEETLADQGQGQGSKLTQGFNSAENRLFFGVNPPDNRIAMPLGLVTGSQVAGYRNTAGGTVAFNLSPRPAAGVWDAQSAAPLTNFLALGWFDWFSPFSPDGERILALANGYVRVCSATDGRALDDSLLKEDWYWIWLAQFSPDGRRILTLSGDNALIWDAETKVQLTKPFGQGKAATTAQMSPDGNWFLTATIKAVRVWSARTGQPLSPPFGPGGELRSAQFSPDGSVITITKDNRVSLWELGREPLPELDQAPGRVSWTSNFVPTGARSPAWLIELGEAVSAHTPDKASGVAPVTDGFAGLFQRFQRQVDQDSNGGDWQVWGHWFLADPRTRPISPLSSRPLPRYLEDLIKTNTAQSLREAERLASGEADLLRRIHDAQSVLPEPPAAPGNLHVISVGP